MKRAWTLACGLLLLCCRRPRRRAPRRRRLPIRKIVADWNGGRATLTDVEGALLALSPSERLSREADIVKTYQEVAREKALAQILLPQAPGGGQAALEPSAPEAYRQVLAQLYSRDVALQGRDVAVGEDEVKAFYDGHPKQFRRDRQRLPLQHLPAGAATRGSEDRRGLPGRASRSASRPGSPSRRWPARTPTPRPAPTTGRWDWVDRGAMAPQLDRVAFSLKEGQVSDPIAVPTGRRAPVRRRGWS